MRHLDLPQARLGPQMDLSSRSIAGEVEVAERPRTIPSPTPVDEIDRRLTLPTGK